MSPVKDETRVCGYMYIYIKESCAVTEIFFALLAFTQDFAWCWEYIVKHILCRFLFNILITRLTVIDTAPLTVLFCNCPLTDL